MQSPSAAHVPSPAAAPSGKEVVTLYHWLVLILAALGWLFDCMGQRIFVLSREPAMRELLGAAASDAAVRRWGGTATFLLMAGWATGGILFGMVSDRYGRVKAMLTTLIAYTIFSGLSGFAHTGMEFLMWRFLFGLGVGGMFGAATTLVAESVPAHFRTMALGTMQSVSAVGNMLASGLSLRIPPGQENVWGHYSGWQVLSFAGVVPMLLAVPIIFILKEPAGWKKAKAEAARPGGGRSVGSLPELFRHPRWRHNLLVGICLGVAGMVGLWGIAFFSPELITTAFRNQPLQTSDILQPAQLCTELARPANAAVARVQSRISPALLQELSRLSGNGPLPAATLDLLVGEYNRIIQQDTLYDADAFRGIELHKATRNLAQRVQAGEHGEVARLNRQLLEQLFPGTIRVLQRTIDHTKSQGTMLQDVGAVLGMFAFTLAAAYLNRRTAFLSAFILCTIVVSFVFYSLKTATDVNWMLPLLGFATLSVFAGYSIYFPELFPTRLRGTGVGFCYNTVRYLAAPFPFLLGWLGTLMPFRTVAIMMCSIYFVGIVALLWAPETKGKPLPED
jgi:MFS family permease